MESRSATFVIRKAAMRDWLYLPRVVRDIFPELNDAEVSRLLRWNHGGTVVACHGRNIIGYYQVCPRGETGVAWLNYIGVLSPWQGHGAADALLSMCEKHARTCGFSSIALDVFAHNARACRFYERNGYVQVSTISTPPPGKVRFLKMLSQAEPLPYAMPSLRPACAVTRALRKLVYDGLYNCSGRRVNPEK